MKRIFLVLFFSTKYFLLSLIIILTVFVCKYSLEIYQFKINNEILSGYSFALITTLLKNGGRWKISPDMKKKLKLYKRNDKVEVYTFDTIGNRSSHVMEIYVDKNNFIKGINFQKP